jgi:hypothetical protein
VIQKFSLGWPYQTNAGRSIAQKDGQARKIARVIETTPDLPRPPSIVVVA